jgi:hypothetical protein
MPRSEGFAVMDVSTDIVNDPKFRKLQRHAADAVGTAFTAYIALVAESWKAGRRVRLDDAWPAFLPFDVAAAESLEHAGLIDKSGLLPIKAWRSWFDPANERRRAARDSWNRSKAIRHDDAVPNADDLTHTASKTRGIRAVTAAPGPSVPVRSGPSVPDDGRVDLEAYLVITRRAPTPRQRLLLDGLLDRHDRTGPQWAADIMYRNPENPIGAVIEADKAWRAERIAEAQAAEKPKPVAHRSRALPESTREILDHWAAQKKEQPV